MELGSGGQRVYMRVVDTRSLLALALVLGMAVPAAAQEAHVVRFEGVDRELEVYHGSRHLCRTPCERSYLGGARVRFGFAPGETRRSLAAHRDRTLDLAELEPVDVFGPRTLRVEWVEHREARIAGDVILVVGVTLGALVGGTFIAAWQSTDDDAFFAAGVVGGVVMGLSLVVGIPLAVFDDEVRLATAPTPP